MMKEEKLQLSEFFLLYSSTITQLWHNNTIGRKNYWTDLGELILTLPDSRRNCHLCIIHREEAFKTYLLIHMKKLILLLRTVHMRQRGYKKNSMKLIYIWPSCHHSCVNKQKYFGIMWVEKWELELL